MVPQGGDVNLQIALTILQYIALALPAIYLFADHADLDFNTNKRQFVKGSVGCFIIGALLLLISIASNIQSTYVGEYVSGNVEAIILGTSILFVALGTIQFGLSVVVVHRVIMVDDSWFPTHYYRALRKTFRSFRL